MVTSPSVIFLFLNNFYGSQFLKDCLNPILKFPLYNYFRLLFAPIPTFIIVIIFSTFCFVY